MRFRPAVLIVPAILALIGSGVYAQRERQVPPPSETSDEYSEKFFNQLRLIFGRFRDADLRRVFDSARAVKCSDLTTDKGEWREVAFFNENRKLGDWYRTSLEEVKGDLAVYIFKGGCGGARAALQVTTKFPVEESYDRAVAGKIQYDQIDVNVNAPVSVIFDPPTQAYTFDLPYLFHVTRDGEPVYTLYPRRLSDQYASDMTNHWDCKAVAAEDVTYQFLICRTSVIPRGGRLRNEVKGTSFGSTAYSILSDGKEASSSVTLSFGDEPVRDRARPEPPPKEEAPVPNARASAVRVWKPVTPQTRLTDVGQSEFRLQFKPEIWKGKIDRPQLVEDGFLETFTAAPRNKDYCLWRPSAPPQATQLLEPSKAESTIHTLGFRKDGQAVVAAFQVENDSGTALGSLQCSFPQTATPADVPVSRLNSVFGPAISLEIPNP